MAFAKHKTMHGLYPIKKVHEKTGWDTVKRLIISAHYEREQKA
jgi:hypothetical protein